jgi:hypothetical protein
MPLKAVRGYVEDALRLEKVILLEESYRWHSYE